MTFYPLWCAAWWRFIRCHVIAFYPLWCAAWWLCIRCHVQRDGVLSFVMWSVFRFIQRHLITFHPMACESILSTVLRGGVLSYVTICNAFYPMWCAAWWRFILCFGMAFYPLWCAARWRFVQCCGSGMIYSGSGSSFEFSEFQIQAKVPDPCGSGSNLY